MWRVPVFATALLATLASANAQAPGRLPPSMQVPGLPGTPPALPIPPKPENLTTFDYRLAELRWAEDHWQLWAGAVWLKDFGRREHEAREALRLVRELRLTQHGVVGTPQPVMEYWLADGKAPRAVSTNLKLVALDSDTLRVDSAAGQWSVRDEHRQLFTFGAHADDAYLALDVIRRHGFNQVGYVGQPVPAMIYFLAGPDKAASFPTPRAGTRTVLPGQSARTHVQMKTDKLPGSDRATPLQDLKQTSLSSGRQLANANPLLPDLTALGDRVPLDWRQVQVRREGASWKLAMGGYVLADFGTDERSARVAHAAVQHYRFTEHVLVGAPVHFSYFLCNSQAPRGVPVGVQALPFNPSGLTVQPRDGAFVVADGYRPLVRFNDKTEAEYVLKVIQRQQFDRLCRVGSGEQGLTFLARVR